MSERAGFLAEACRDDDVRLEVQSLLEKQTLAKNFLERPAFEQAVIELNEDAGDSWIDRQVGGYHVVSLLGAGGMGQVYRAHDTRLKRDVAIKVLPEEFSRNNERVIRFQREAVTLASLNHPNIAAIYDVQQADSSRYIVLELVEGAPLSQIIQRGPLPIVEVVDIARQICDALEAAHEKGIVHRDLKPANVMISNSRVKLLDFGLAKLQDDATLTRSKIMGTPAYMAPEQLEGKTCDARVDIYALGLVLYEMATGKRFEATSANLNVLPEKFAHIVARCVERDPNRRWQAVRDVKLEMEWAVTADRPPDVSASKNRPVRKPILIAAGALAALAFVFLGIRYLELGRSDSTGPTFTQVSDLPGMEEQPTISPDGKSVAYAYFHTVNGVTRVDVYLQRIGGTPINLTRDSGADNTSPVFSPDGEQIAFVSGNFSLMRPNQSRSGLFVMGSTGESVRRIGDICYDPSWSPDAKVIVCSTLMPVAEQPYHAPVGQLWRVEVATGQRRTISKTDAVQPDWSPHGSRIAYAGIVNGSFDVFTIPANGGDPVPVTHDAARDWDPRWAPDGRHLYFISDRGGGRNLWRIDVDEATGRVAGGPEPVTAGATSVSQPTISRDGRRIAYTYTSRDFNVFKLDLDPVKGVVVGGPQAITQGPRQHGGIAVSPDGNWIAYNTVERRELYVMQSDGSNVRRLTNDASSESNARWSPDGRRIAFLSDRSGQNEIWIINSDGGGLRQLTFTGGETVLSPGSWSPNGKQFVYNLVRKEPRIFDVDTPWDKQRPEPLPPIPQPEKQWIAGPWSSDGARLALCTCRAGGADNSLIYSFSTHTYTELHLDTAYPAAWLNDSQHILTYAGETIGTFDTITNHSHTLFSVSPDGFGSVSASTDSGTIYFVRAHRESDVWMMTLK